MQTYKKILSIFCLVSSLMISANISGNVVNAKEKAAPNLPNGALTVLESEKYVQNDKLYRTVTKLPALTEKMEALNSVCASIVKTKKLNLVILDTREATSPKAIKSGYPEGLFHAVDTANSIPQKLGNNIITGSHMFIVVENKNAKKALGIEPLIYIKNTVNGTISKADLQAAQKEKKELASLQDFLNLPQISLAKNSREFAIAQMVFKNAEQNHAKAK